MLKPYLVGALFLGLACATSAPEHASPGISDSKSHDPRVVQDAELAVDVTKPPYKPQLTPDLNIPGNIVWGVFRVCADQEGKVFDVKVVTSAAPQVDNQWQETLRTWRYQPYLAEGRPTPFCNNVRVEVKAQT
jgi:hypothetical protein